MPEDRAKVLAYKIEQALKCDSCGTRLDEWADNRNAYYVEADRCIGCEKVAWEQHAWNEEPTTAYGIRFRLIKPK